MTHKTFRQLDIGQKFKTNCYESFWWIKISDTSAQVEGGEFKTSIPLPNSEVIEFAEHESICN